MCAVLTFFIYRWQNIEQGTQVKLMAVNQQFDKT